MYPHVHLVTSPHPQVTQGLSFILFKILFQYFSSVFFFIFFFVFYNGNNTFSKEETLRNKNNKRKNVEKYKEAGKKLPIISSCSTTGYNFVHFIEDISKFQAIFFKCIRQLLRYRRGRDCLLIGDRFFLMMKKIPT